MSEQETWGQVKQRLIEEFNADPNNILDKSVCRLDWYGDRSPLGFIYKTVVIDSVGLEVFKFVEFDHANRHAPIFHDWGYSLVCNNPDDPEQDTRDASWPDWNKPNVPHFPTVTEAIVAAQEAAIKYLEAGIQERQAVVDQLKGKA